MVLTKRILSIMDIIATLKTLGIMILSILDGLNHSADITH